MNATDQQQLIRALRDPGRYPWPVARVRLIETHISYLLLAGERVLKIKKALDLGFVDGSTLARRRHFCAEELRLNRRLAPDHYLDTASIAGSAVAPEIHIGDSDGAIEYAVLMRRFPQSALMDRLLARGRLPAAAIHRLAASVAAFHRAQPPAPADSRYGDLAAVATPMRENFRQLAQHGRYLPAAALTELEAWTEAELAQRAELIAQRRTDGHVRECHGDLHLGNMAWLGGELLVFDAIDFSPELRWIDTASEIAFTAMDLEYRGAIAPARHFINDYLEHGGDYGAVALQSLYRCYRALVRAKISAIQAAQQGGDAAAALREQAAAYLALAQRCRQPPGAQLSILCGLSGSGKSRLAAARLAAEGGIRLRSDVERKRLFGLSADSDATAAPGAGLYSAEASRRTYARLLELADALLAAGQPVFVDATFLHRSERDRFRALASRCGCPFRILHTRAPPALLRRRIRRRRRSGGDASEATTAVLEQQLAHFEPPAADEQAFVELVSSERAEPIRPVPASPA